MLAGSCIQPAAAASVAAFGLLLLLVQKGCFKALHISTHVAH